MRLRTRIITIKPLSSPPAKVAYTAAAHWGSQPQPPRNSSPRVQRGVFGGVTAPCACCACRRRRQFRHQEKGCDIGRLVIIGLQCLRAVRPSVSARTTDGLCVYNDGDKSCSLFSLKNLPLQIFFTWRPYERRGAK